MAVNTNVEEVLANWGTGMSGAGAKYEAGVKRVTVNPAEAAIAQKDVMRQNFLEALDSGKWERGLASTTLQSWQDACINVGRSRLTSGVDKGKVKLQKVLPNLLNFIKTTVESLPSRGTKDQNRDRMNMFFDKMSEFRKTA